MLDPNRRIKVRIKWRTEGPEAAHRARSSNQYLLRPVSAYNEAKFGNKTQ